jgi:hypothetical protein
MKSTRLFQFAGSWLMAALVVTNSFVATAQSTNESATIDLSTVRTIADRNIFDPNRTPRMSYSHTRPAQAQPDSFTFVGSMSYDKGDFAFFDGTSPEFHKVAQVDDSIASYKVAAIDPDSVTLVTDTNELVLQLGEEMRDDGNGHWVSANNVPSFSGTRSGSGRNGRFSFRRNRGGFNRGGTSGEAGRRNTPGTAAAPAAADQQQPADDSMAPADDNTTPTPPDNVIIVPVDVGGQQDATPGQ